MSPQPQRRLIQAAILPVLSLLFSQATHAQAAKPAGSVKIAVLEEGSRQGVPSKIVLLRGSKDKIPVDETDPSGVLALSHDCVLGERFYAEPKDASFFQSDEVTCKKELTLLVVRRETPAGILVQRSSRVLAVKFKDGSQATYLVSASGRVRSQAIQDQRPVQGPFGINSGFDVECRTSAMGSIEQSITRISETGGLSASAVLANRILTPGEQINKFERGPCSPGALANLEKVTARQVDNLALEESAYATSILTNLLPMDDRRKLVGAMAGNPSEHDLYHAAPAAPEPPK